MYGSTQSDECLELQPMAGAGCNSASTNADQAASSCSAAQRASHRPSFWSRLPSCWRILVGSDPIHQGLAPRVAVWAEFIIILATAYQELIQA